MATLIACQGLSPVSVMAIYELLWLEQIDVDRVELLVAKEGNLQESYRLCQEYLVGKAVYHPLNLQDADSVEATRAFLHEFYSVLEARESLYAQRGDDAAVYISLAGCHKSMAALMAMLAPSFSCVKKICNIIDSKENVSENCFPSAYDISMQSMQKQAEIMNPDLGRLSLVSIPFERKEISKKIHRQLLRGDYGQVDPEPGTLEILVSKNVVDQFKTLCKHDVAKAEAVRNVLLEMGRITQAETCNVLQIGPETYKVETYSYKVTKRSRVTLRYFTGLDVPVRPVYFATPEQGQVERVVICSLEEDTNGGYRPLKEVADSPEFDCNHVQSITMLPPVPLPAESVLIVPLGTTPIIATQLYTLLTEQENRTIREVVLIYPQKATEILSCAELIQQALRTENNTVHCRIASITGLEDACTEDECRAYQAALEGEIDRVRQEYPQCKIDLALSGGRKDMTAMTIFAAQKKHIPYVYHTLITDEELGYQIAYETSFTKLKHEMSLQKACDRLFLRTYNIEGQDPYAGFILFAVPVFFGE